MEVKTKDWSQAQRNFVIDLFKLGKTFRLTQEEVEMALQTIIIHARNHFFQKPIESEDSHLLRNM